MATRYWVGGSGNWNDSTHWSATSGGVGGASVPTSDDDVYFDSNSGAGTINVNTTANMRDCTFAQTQLITLANAAYPFNIFGNWTLCSNTYLNTSFTGTGYVYLKATTSVNITSNGCTKGWNYLYFDGVGGIWNLTDDCVFQTIKIGSGRLNTNNYTITWNEIRRISGIFTLDLGSSTCNAGNGILLGTITDNNLTIIPGTSNIIINGDWIGGAGKTFYNITYNRLSNSFMGGTAGNFTCYNFTIEPNPGVKTNLSVSDTILVTNLLTINGYNKTDNRVLINSNTVGTPRSITVNGTITASNVDFRDIVGAGTANWDLSAIEGGAGDCGGNSGITFTPTQTQYFKHTSGSVNWSDVTKWFSNYERTIQGRVPLPQDDAIFDENSFTGASTLNVNIPRIGKNIDMSKINKNISLTIGNNIDCYGSLYLSNYITSFNFGANQLNMHGRNDDYYLDFGLVIPYTFNVYSINGKYTLNNNLNPNYSITTFNLYNGTFDFNDYNGIIRYFASYPNTTIYLGNGTITITRGNGGGWSINNTTILYSEYSTLKFLTQSSTTTLTSNFGSKTYNKIWYSGNPLSYGINGSNSFNEIIIESGKTLNFTNGTTQTINKLTAIGTPDKPITIGSTTAGSKYTLNITGTEPIETDYINITDCNVTQTNKFYAGVNSINGGNNTNVIFDYVKLPLNMNLYTLKMYDKVLTDDEVLQNYNATKSRYII